MQFLQLVGQLPANDLATVLIAVILGVVALVLLVGMITFLAIIPSPEKTKNAGALICQILSLFTHRTPRTRRKRVR